MFHVKHFPLEHVHRSARLGVIAVAALLILVASGCGSVSVPEGWAAPLTAGEHLLIGNGNGSVSAFRRDNLTNPVWTFPADVKKDSGWFSFLGGSKGELATLKGLYATPVIAKVDGRDRVILAAYSGEIIAIDLLTGQRSEGWPQSINVGGHVVATPAFDGKQLFIATQAGTVRTVNVATGELSTKILVQSDERIWSSPILHDGTLYVADLARHIRAVDATSGEVRWERTLSGAAAGDITLAGDLLLVPTLGNRLLALSRADGAERWKFTADNWLWARPLATSDTVYLASASGAGYALDLATGTQRWKFDGVQSETRATPVLLADTLVLATDNGTILGLDPATGKERWQQHPAGNPRLLADPLVIESTILYTSKKGDIYQVKPSEQGAVARLFQRG